MNIKYKDQDIEYRLLRIGDFFTYEGMLYLKINSSNQKYSAFNCTQEVLAGLIPDLLVRPINIELKEV